MTIREQGKRQKGKT